MFFLNMSQHFLFAWLIIENGKKQMLVLTPGPSHEGGSILLENECLLLSHSALS